MSTSTIQFTAASDLGIYRAANNYFIPLTTNDPEPNSGSMTYSITTGTLPPYIELDPVTGYLYGYLEYETDYLNTNVFNITAVKTFADLTTATTSSNFSLTVKGFIDTEIEWVTSSTLGSIYLGYPSLLKVEAQETINNFDLKYSLLSGSLPPGLSLTVDGAIAGEVAYGSTGTYSFSIGAKSDYDSTTTNRTFNLQTANFDGEQYTKIYFRPFFSKDKRSQYQLFINNPLIFPQDLIYRYFDSNFGVQSDMKMFLHFGIEKLILDQYTQALRQNFYKRRFTLGKIKTAIAKDDNDSVVYEIIYLDIVDNFKNVPSELYATRNVSVSYSGGSAGQIVYGTLDTETDDIYYPASVNNMRNQLKRIQLDDFSTIKVNKYLEPLFMRTAQTNGPITNYIPVVPLCYVKPGKSKQILKKITASGFKFNTLDFEIDRIVVQNSLDNASAKYLLFERESISDSLDTDAMLYQGDVLWQFDDGVQLTRTS